MKMQRPFRLSAAVALSLLVTSACEGTSPGSLPGSVEIPTVAQIASISGKVLYGSGDPFLRVYAREVNTGIVQWVTPPEGELAYAIPDLPAGTYVVVGWFHPLGASGAYTSLDTVVAETEGQMRACEEAIVEIELQPGEPYAGADIGCWGGDFFSLAE